MKVFRRQLIVDKSFQYRQIATAVLTTILVANLMLLAAFVFFPYEFSAVVGPFTWVIGIMEVFLIALVFYFVLRSSHRVAGPAFSLKRTLSRLGDGDLTVRSRLRKADYLKDVADCFNENVQRLEELVGEVRIEAEALRDSLPDGSPSRVQAERLTSRLAVFSSGRAGRRSRSVEKSSSAGPLATEGTATS